MSNEDDTVGRPLTHDDLWSIPVPSDPQLSPDGQQVAYVVTTAVRDHDEYRSHIWVVAADGGTPRRLTNGPADLAPRWSPDGCHLAFLGRRGDGEAPQLHLLPTAGGEARALTALAHGAGEPVWSPDGSRLAFSAGVELAGAGAGGAAGEHEPVVAERLGYKADGAGLIGGRRRHLFVVPADGDAGSERQVTFGDCSASTPVWSPDGVRLAYATSRGVDRDLQVASVVHVVPAAGGEPTALSPADGLYDVAGWSPDGSTLLLYGEPSLSAGNQHLYALAAAGGEPVPLAPAYDRNVMPGAPGYPGARPRYSGEGARVLFCARDAGAVHVLEAPAGGGEPAVVVGGDRVVSGLSVAGDRLAFVAASPTSPGEVWLTEDAVERLLTDLFASALPAVRLVEPRPATFEAPDGTPLHGWVLRGRADGPGPLLVDVHGGPHNAWGPVFDGAHLYHQTLAAAGWTVLTLNPRGSDGYGEAFRTAAVGAWGQADEADFLAAVDALVADGLVDPERVAVSGYSYGGYMTCWLTARTSRFKAAVAGGCVSDLVSMAGTSDAGRYLARVELGVADVAEGADALRAASPLAHAAAVRTPTLILQGEDDDRCPVGQAEQWFSILRAQRVPVQLVRYPGASHLFILNGRPSHRVDYGRRLEAWVTAHAGDRRPRARAGQRIGAGDLRGRLEDLVARHGVPGASVAVLAGGEVATAAAGVLNVDTGVEATPDSLFQIGSITKVYTASLVMQLVDEGRADLDAPVVELLPELQLGDPDATKAVTLRHLLSHTSGIQGDHFPDLGRGDDCVARFVETCAELGQSHPLGATMSYCNTGFVVAGRVVEAVTGQTWDQALAERLVSPLGLSHTVTLPEEVLRYQGAMGHVGKPGEAPRPAPAWGLPRSIGPAGLICATAADVVAFARMHLDGGLAAGGERVLSASSVGTMQAPQVAVPDPYTLGSHWGVGWILFDWDGRRLFGHDGNTLGQSAYLRVVPDCDVAICLLTNGGNGQDLFQELYRGLLDDLAGLAMPHRPEPPDRPVEAGLDLSAPVGVYERLGLRMEVEERDGHLVARTIVTGPLASLVPDPVEEHELVAVSSDLFVTREPGTQSWIPMVFYRLADGSPYVHFGARATPKVS